MSISAETQVPCIDPRVEFWSMRGARWPRNWHKHVFAGRVVHRTGKLLYREAWTGYEPETRLILPLPARLDSATRRDELNWAINLLNLYYPPYDERYKEAIAAGQNAPLPTLEEWQIVVGLSKQISNDSYAAVQRFRQVVDLLVALLERGILRAGLRPYFYGDPVELPASDWYNEVYHAWFATCQVDLDNPFSGVPVRASGHWIVFEAESFEAWEASVASIQPGMNSAQPAKPEETAASGEAAVTPEAASSVNGASTGSAAQPIKPEVPSQPANDAPPDSSAGPAASVEPAEEKKAKPDKGRKRAGAKPSYPWSEGKFQQRVLELVQGETPPRSMHELVDIMLGWCSVNWDREPCKTTVTQKIEAILARHRIEFP